MPTLQKLSTLLPRNGRTILIQIRDKNPLIPTSANPTKEIWVTPDAYEAYVKLHAKKYAVTILEQINEGDIKFYAEKNAAKITARANNESTGLSEKDRKIEELILQNQQLMELMRQSLSQNKATTVTFEPVIPTNPNPESEDLTSNPLDVMEETNAESDEKPKTRKRKQDNAPESN